MKMFNSGYLRNEAPHRDNTYTLTEREKLESKKNSLAFTIKDLTKIYKSCCKLMITAVNEVALILNLA